MKTTNRFTTTKIVAASIALVALIAACDTTPKAKTVNDIVLTPKQLSVPITTYDIGNYSFQSVMVGNSIRPPAKVWISRQNTIRCPQPPTDSNALTP